jgi:DNA-binding NtrC family response regulator
MCCDRPKRWRRPPASPSADVPDQPFGEPDAVGIVGESEAVAQLRRDVAFVAKRAAHVLVLGPSGSGKELVAQGIHALSSRRAKRIVSRNAATFPETLVDAELFGNAPNYPNHGMPERAGLVGEADGSTLFLDELGELPEALQTRLLRLLDSGEYQRLGDSRRRTASFRFVAATNRPIETLREDVAARVKLRLTVPGLNERREDVPLLVRHLLRRIAREDDEVAARFFEGGDAGAGEPRVGPEIIKVLCRRTFTTHVREVEAILWRAIAASEGDEVEIGPTMRDELERCAAPVSPEDVTADELREVLARVGGVRERAWRELGLANRYVLKRLLKKHGMGDLDPG